jgi:hypothetical protein
MKKITAFIALMIVLAACNNNNNKMGGWSKESENKFMNECVNSSGTNPQAKQICSCVLGKLEKKYATSAEADAKGSEQEGRDLATECMNGGNINNNNNNNNLNNRNNTDNNNNLNGNNIDNNNNNNQGNNWTDQQRQLFIQQCSGEAMKAQGFDMQQANNYCDCMTRKIEQKYTFQQANALTTADLSTPEWRTAMIDCGARQQ